MKKWVNLQEEKGRTTKRDTKSKGKKLYHRPRLTVYGSLSQLTGAKGGTKGDGGGAHSKF